METYYTSWFSEQFPIAYYYDAYAGLITDGQKSFFPSLIVFINDKGDVIKEVLLVLVLKTLCNNPVEHFLVYCLSKRELILIHASKDIVDFR